MNDWLSRIEKNIRSRKLLARGQSLLVAVSGGLDSMVLLRVLHELSSVQKWKLTVAHFNHQLRGRSSDADEKLVRSTCQKYKVPLIAASANVKRFAKEQGISIEMAARKLRHDFLARAASENNISTIALAHHADDQVELFFLRLLRGSGGEGLAGMKWSSPSPSNANITLVRPLLDQPKELLREFAKKYKVLFREDASNASLDYQRNQIRHELLPVLKKYKSTFAPAVLRSMEITGSEADLIISLAKAWLKTQKPSFAKLHVAVQRRVLLLQLRALDVAADFELVERLRDAPGQPFSVSPTLAVFRDVAGKVRLQTVEQIGFAIGEQTIDLSRKGEITLNAKPSGSLKISWDLKKCKGINISREPGLETFDADKVGRKVTVRYWRAGDRFQPIGLKSPVKLQDLFTNLKVPRSERHQKAVAVAENGDIFWVEGLRIAERFKLDNSTVRQLKWTWSRL